MKFRFLRLICCAFALVLCLGLLTTRADAAETTIVASGTCGENLTWTLDDAGTLIIEGEGEMQNLGWDTPWGTDIRCVIIEEGVTSIGDLAFRDCGYLTLVTIPDSVCHIGVSAFNGCKNLAEISIPWSVTSISPGTFMDCDSITEIYIPPTVTSIGDGAFAGCNGLTEVYIPWGVMEIGESAFYNCQYLTKIHIPVTVNSIGRSAFAKCYSLKEINLPEGITVIDDYLFESCMDLVDITIPKNVTSVGSHAFGRLDYAGSDGYGCSMEIEFLGYAPIFGNDSFVNASATVYYPSDNPSWTDDVMQNYGGDVTWLGSIASGKCDNNIIWTLYSDGKLIISGQGALNSCPWSEYKEQVTRLVIHDGITKIGASVFQGHTNMVSASLPDSITSIGNYAFAQCGSLTSIHIPAGVTRLEYFTFAWCSSLESVTFGGAVTEFQQSIFQYCTGLKEIELPDSVTTLGHYTFSGCSSLQSIELPASMVEVSASLFRDCTALESIVIPEGVTCVRDNAFYNCGALRDITIPASVVSVESNAFMKCASLQNVHISDLEAFLKIEFGNLRATPFVSDIAPQYLYLNEEVVTDLVVPEGITKLYDYALEGCALTSVTLPEGLTELGQYAFGRCAALQSISLPSTLATVGLGAFYDCTGLTQINVADVSTLCTFDNLLPSVDMERHLYVNRALATEITIPEGVEVIPNSAFRNFVDLQQVYLPEGLLEISDWAFNGCISLEKANIPGSVTVIGSSIFGNCTALSEVTLGEGLARLGGRLFENCENLKSIVIPASVTGLNNGLDYCYGLETVYFLGDAPTWFGYLGGFKEVTATAYYPAGNETWPAAIVEGYGGNITWVAYCPYGHRAVTDPGYAAACTTEGLTEGTHCGDCGEVLAEQEAIPALGHVHGEPVRENETELGTCDMVVYCTVCGQELSREYYSPYPPGDLNGDNEINNKDLMWLFKYLTDYDLSDAANTLDFNGDGVVNNKDLVRLFQYISGWDVQLYEPTSVTRQEILYVREDRKKLGEPLLQ